VSVADFAKFHFLGRYCPHIEEVRPNLRCTHVHASRESQCVCTGAHESVHTSTYPSMYRSCMWSVVEWGQGRRAEGSHSLCVWLRAILAGLSGGVLGSNGRTRGGSGMGMGMGMGLGSGWHMTNRSCMHTPPGRTVHSQRLGLRSHGTELSGM